MELVGPHISVYPSNQTGSVQPLAGHPRRYIAGAATGSPRVIFDATDGQEVVVSLIVKRQDDSFTILRPALGGSNSFDEVLADPWSSITYLGILVTNGVPGSPPVAYTLDVLDDTLVDVTAASGRPLAARLDAAPNPSRGAVRLSITAEGGVRALRILDVLGREVARVAAPNRSDRFDVVWDGRDARGRVLPAGMYWAVAETKAATLVAKIALLR
jgi:hypothetical protein